MVDNMKLSPAIYLPCLVPFLALLATNDNNLVQGIGVVLLLVFAASAGVWLRAHAKQESDQLDNLEPLHDIEREK